MMPGTRPRFIADADLNNRIVTGIRRYAVGIEFWTADEGGTQGLDDPSVLAIAATANRILVSHDSNTMTGHFYHFVAVENSPGLIIVPQDLDPGEAIEDLQLIWEASEAEEYRNYITWLPLSRGD